MSRALMISLAATICAAVALAACGGSSKPSYCSSVSNLEASIKALPSTNIVQSGVNGLKTAVAKVQSDAETAINDAKSDLPTETTDLKNSVDGLSTAVKAA